MNRREIWRIWLLKSLQLQLFLTLVSLPFLIWWGLPVSIMSVVSTLLFTPFLTVFLLVSSLLFFSELLGIPNGCIVWALEIITKIWFFVLEKNYVSWLIGLSKPSIFVLFFILGATLAIMHSKQIKTSVIRIVFLATLLVGTCGLLMYCAFSSTSIETMQYNKKEMTLLHTDNTLICVDKGSLGSRASYESFINYTLLPDIVQKTGKMTIDHLVMCTINQRTFNAVAFLATKMTVKNIYLAWWDGKIPPGAWSAYVKLKKAVSLSGGKIISISKKRHFFSTKTSSLFIEPHQKKQIRYHDATYPMLSIHGMINDKSITINTC